MEAPEIVAARLEAGPGAASLHDAAAAWHKTAMEYRSAGQSVRTIAAQTPWTGPSASAMRAKLAEHATSLESLATVADRTATAAQSAATAYRTARISIVSSATVIANRTALAAAQTGNVLGQNAGIIAALESQYATMYATNAAVMNTYTAQSAAATAALQSQPPTQTPAASELSDLLNGLDGATAGPWSTFLNSGFFSSATNIFASGFAPTGIVQDITSFGFLTAFLQQAASVNAINNTRILPTPIDVEAVPSIERVQSPPVNIRLGAGGNIGGLRVPPAWAQTPTVNVSVPTVPGAAVARPPIMPPLMMPLPARATGQPRERETPEYGDRPRMVPHTPAGG